MRMLLVIVALGAVSAPLAAQSDAGRPLDHAAYEVWRDLDDETLSPDGRWLGYTLTLQDGDPELYVHDLASEVHYVIARGQDVQFAEDARFAVFTIAPALEAVRAARRADTNREDLPKDTLGILDLASGDITRVPNLEDFRLGDDASAWLAYRVTPQEEKEETEEALPEQADSAAAEPEDGEGSTLVVRALATGAETRFDWVTAYAVSDDGVRVAFVSGAAEDSLRGVYIVEHGAASPRAVLTGAGSYRGLAFDEEGEQLAFLGAPDGEGGDEEAAEGAADEEGAEDEIPEVYRLYHWRAGADGVQLLAEQGTDGVPDGWAVSEHRDPGFSRDGRRVFFGTAPMPEPEPEDSLLDEERVTVDIWHWQDPYLQPMQQERLRQERERNYLAVAHLRNGRIVQLATEMVPGVEVGTHGNADIAVGTSDLPYRKLISWDFPSYRDVYLVDVERGTRQPVLERTQANPELSPEARYLYWYDNQERAWLARRVDGGRAVNLTATIPHAIHRVGEDHSWPYPPFPYGTAGWTEGDERLLVYDRYDLWAVDPSGRGAPRSVTEETGRARELRFRYVQLDREEDAIDPEAPMLLSAFQLETKDAGFFRDRVRGDGAPEQLLLEPKRFTTPRKAEHTDQLMYRRSDVDEFPDVWVSGPDFADAQRVSEANLQQAEYRWATVELVEWQSSDGVPLQGLLYKPEDFDPSQRYPLMVNFYERDSDNLHTYFAPVPHRSVIRPVFYASRGYLVFMPDIHYELGYPGESALQSVVPGVLELIERGYVDAERIGVQGHSWGGYQIAYMVTRTDLFRAAGAGAPVSNMVSAYGGIRWGSGMSRMFQYERTQSRIGASLWETPLRYLENSPIFWADRIETPLLIMHNDRDHAVPWEQGIELFVALRRLGKPAWLVNYTDEVHWPRTFAERRDWNIRMQQFFDHYLMDAPAPVWLGEGVPAIEQGRTLGLELTGAGQSSERR
ncbi:MAG: prolyl oligopeptidase family serine peptidase [Gemmatimonadales bacterium]|jgi:dienelactone hydrolase